MNVTPCPLSTVPWDVDIDTVGSELTVIVAVPDVWLVQPDTVKYHDFFPEEENVWEGFHPALEEWVTVPLDDISFPS